MERPQTTEADEGAPPDPSASEDIEDYPCSACGADLTFAPGTSSMKCPYCGTENAIAEDGAAIEEHGLEVLPLSPATRDRGMEIAQRSFKCDNCHAVQAVEASSMATECVYCGSHAILEVPSNPDIIRPSALVPFAFDIETARRRYRQWLGSWWRKLISPGALTREAVVTKIRGVYAPFFTFDARAESDWSGLRGDYYYVTEGSGENRRQVRKIRWTRRSGHRSHFYDDVLIYASRGLPEEALGRVMPFQTQQLVPFQGQYLAGFAAEEYTRDPRELWGQAQNAIKSTEWDACRRELGGDTYRDLRVQTRLLDPTWKHVLLPLYVATYLYGGRPYQFLVNGQTGEVQGSAPISWGKVSLLLGTIVAAAVGIGHLLGLF